MKYIVWRMRLIASILFPRICQCSSPSELFHVIRIIPISQDFFEMCLLKPMVFPGLAKTHGFSRGWNWNCQVTDMGLAKFVIGKTYTTCGTLDGGGRLLKTEMGMAERPNQADILGTLREFELLCFFFVCFWYPLWFEISQGVCIDFLQDTRVFWSINCIKSSKVVSQEWFPVWVCLKMLG